MTTEVRLSSQATVAGGLQVGVVLPNGSRITIDFPSMGDVRQLAATHAAPSVDEIVAAFLSGRLSVDPEMSEDVSESAFTFEKGISADAT